MTIGATTLTGSEQAKFETIVNNIASNQAECLCRLIGLEFRDAFANRSTKGEIQSDIADWIRTNVLNATPRPDYIDLLQNR
jgi:hypothetical protein